MSIISVDSESKIRISERNETFHLPLSQFYIIHKTFHTGDKECFMCVLNYPSQEHWL
jgi:hypothetical protein